VNIGIAYEGWFDLGHKQMELKEQRDIDKLNERINLLQQQLNDLKLKHI
jgi:polyhydroxyalkanoate synthesis regulator phasin